MLPGPILSTAFFSCYGSLNGMCGLNGGNIKIGFHANRLQLRFR